MDELNITELADLEPQQDYLLIGFQEGKGFLLARYDGVQDDYLVFTDKIAELGGEHKQARFLPDWLFDDIARGVTKVTLVPELS